MTVLSVREKDYPFRPCGVPECEYDRGRRSMYCSMHAERLRIHGSTDDPTPTLKDRLLRRVDPTLGPDECWPWLGPISLAGYGTASSPKGRTGQAHRLMYEEFVGPIAAGLVVDHLCHNRDIACPGGIACMHRRCVNPAHLEPTTISENARRSPAAARARNAMFAARRPRRVKK